MAPTVHAEMCADQRYFAMVVVGDGWDQREAWSAMAEMTPEINFPGGNVARCRLTWPAVVQFSSTFNGRDNNGWWMPGPKLRAWAKQEYGRRTSANGLPPMTWTGTDGRLPRDYQLDGAEQIAHLGRYLLCDEPGLGKAQPETTLVWTPAGWNELGNLVPGDLVYNRYGQPTPVRKVHYQGEQQIWKITFSDRTTTLASGNHLWRVWTKNDRTHADRANHEHGRVLTTDQLRENGLHSADGGARYYLPQQPVLVGGTEDLPLEPYAYGALLGDGCLGGADLSITCPDNEILARTADAASLLGTTWRWDTLGSRCQNLNFRRNGKLRTILAELGALTRSEGKGVHPRYIQAGESARRELLAGLLDTDGCVASGCIEFSSASMQLAADVAWLARSLGAVVMESSPQAAGYRKLHTREYVPCQDKYRLTIRFPANDLNPFRVPRKADAWAAMAAKLQRRNPPRTFASIEPAGRDQVCCIELDTDDPYARVYLTDTSLIPTHNTATSVLGLDWRAAAGLPVLPVIVIAPGWDVCDSWAREIALWKPEWRVAEWKGPKRRELTGTADVYLTTYATARRDGDDYGPLMKLKAATVILDEAHLIKGAKTKQSYAARRLARKAANAVLVTGTPITRSTRDLWSAFEAKDPGAWPSSDRFTGRYCVSHDGEYEVVIEGLDRFAKPEFYAAILGSWRRVAKADVLEQLPPKIYSTRRVEIPEPWLAAYRSMECDMLATLPDGDELPVMFLIEQLTRLVQLSSAAADVELEMVLDEETGEEKPHYNVTLKAPSWKADALLEILAERPGQPVVAFAPSRQLIEISGAAAEAAGYRVGYITGTTSRARRAAYIEAFQRGELDLMAATTGAGGTGITLTAAGTVVFLQRPWSLAESIQAEDRCHRIGSERHNMIEVIDIMALAGGKNTIDARVRNVLMNKGGQLADFLKDERIVHDLFGGSR